MSSLIERLRGANPARCPFDDPKYRMDPEKPCPVCGDLGVDPLAEVHCVSSNYTMLLKEAAQALAEAEAALEEAKIKLTNARATTRVDGRTDAATQHIAAILKDAHSAYDTISQALSTIRAGGGK